MFIFGRMKVATLYFFNDCRKLLWLVLRWKVVEAYGELNCDKYNSDRKFCDFLILELGCIEVYILLIYLKGWHTYLGCSNTDFLKFNLNLDNYVEVNITVFYILVGYFCIYRISLNYFLYFYMLLSLLFTIFIISYTHYSLFLYF
jgi:hypothetical protein